MQDDGAGTTRLAGTAVHVNISAVDVAPSSASGDLLTHRYEWDFGDTTLGSSHNKLVGFNAAHVYDTPGTYSITLREYDGSGNLITQSNGSPIANPVMITVSSMQRTPVYVSSTGSSSGTGGDVSSAISVARLKTLLSSTATGHWTDAERDNREYIFIPPSSGAIDVGTRLEFGDLDNCVIRSSSSTTRAIMKVTDVNAKDHVIQIGSGGSRVIVEDVTFDTWASANATTGTLNERRDIPDAIKIDSTVKNLTLRDNDIENVRYFIDTVGAKQIFVEDNVETSPTALRMYFVWMNGENIAIVGNSVANSATEHIVRGGGWTKLLIAENTFVNIDSGVSGDAPKGTIVMQNGQFGYAAGNTITSGAMGIGPLQAVDFFQDTSPENLIPDNSSIVADKLAGTAGSGTLAWPIGESHAYEYSDQAGVIGLLRGHRDEKTQWVVAEGNSVTGTDVELHSGALHVMIRSNIVCEDSTREPYAGFDLSDATSRADLYNRAATDVTIANNTLITAAVHVSFILINDSDTGPNITGLRLYNNLMVAPHNQAGNSPATGPFQLQHRSDLQAFSVTGGNGLNGNIWGAPVTNVYYDGGVNYIGNASDQWKSPSEWNGLTNVGDDFFVNVSLSGFNSDYPDTNALHGSIVAGVALDFYGGKRSSTAPTAGAVERVLPASGLTSIMSASTSVTLSWTDNSSNEAGFRILRSTTSNGTFSPLNSVGPNVTTFTDTGLSAGTNYFYKVVAFSLAADSDPTAIYQATTSTAGVYLSGTVFSDCNANNSRETGEPAYISWTVWLDLDNDLHRDAGEPYSTTDASGHYLFSDAGLTAESYHVRVAYEASVNAVAAKSMTQQTGSDIMFAVGLATIDNIVWLDSDNDGTLLGDGDTPLGGWFVWNDWNFNGIKGAGEPLVITDSSGLAVCANMNPQQTTFCLSAVSGATTTVAQYWWTIHPLSGTLTYVMLIAGSDGGDGGGEEGGE